MTQTTTSSGTGSTSGNGATGGSSGGLYTDPPINAEITSSNFDHYASGNKCEFEWKVSFGLWMRPLGYSARIVWAHCKIGNETLPNSIAQFPGIKFQSVRFASNKFATGSKSITVEAQVEVYDTNTLQTIKTINFKSQPWNIYIYNTVSTVATQVPRGGNPGGIPADPDVSPPQSVWTMVYSAKRIAEYAINETFHPSTSSVNYVRRQTGVAAARSMTEPGIADDLKNSTMLVHSLHANWTGFSDSMNHAEMPDATPGFISSSGTLPNYTDEISTYLTAKQSVTPHLPPLNLALLWNCTTLSGNSTGAPNPYLPNKLGFTSSRKGAGYAGFIGILMASLKPDPSYNDVLIPTTDMISPVMYHAYAVLDRLKSGDTLREAVDFANYEQMPRHMEMRDTLAKPNPMTIMGDEDTRLMNVYAAASERSQFPNWRTSWYLTLP